MGDTRSSLGNAHYTEHGRTISVWHDAVQASVTIEYGYKFQGNRSIGALVTNVTHNSKITFDSKCFTPDTKQCRYLNPANPSRPLVLKDEVFLTEELRWFIKKYAIAGLTLEEANNIEERVNGLFNLAVSKAGKRPLTTKQEKVASRE